MSGGSMAQVGKTLASSSHFLRFRPSYHLLNNHQLQHRGDQRLYSNSDVQLRGVCIAGLGGAPRLATTAALSLAAAGSNVVESAATAGAAEAFGRQRARHVWADMLHCRPGQQRLPAWRCIPQQQPADNFADRAEIVWLVSHGAARRRPSPSCVCGCIGLLGKIQGVVYVVPTK